MLDIQLPKIECVASSENYARYRIEPLERGFGMTLGNALRRVLLSSLPGAAVTAVKIDGVYHEFSHIDHVKEDTTELLLNLKQLRLRSFSDYPVRMSLEVKGMGRVTAMDINAPADVEIVNPELQIATLDSDDAQLSIEMTVERGRGFVPADSRESTTIGVIPIDAIFSPVRRVNFSVENTRVGQQTDFDRLELEVWTDGTITPDDAVSQSAQILLQHLELLADLGGKAAPRQARAALGSGAIPANAYSTPIEDLDLSVRAYNCLKRANISTVGQILEMSDEEIMGVRNFGRKSLDELKEKLAARGFIPPVEPRTEGLAEEEEEAEEEPEAEVPEEAEMVGPPAQPAAEPEEEAEAGEEAAPVGIAGPAAAEPVVEAPAVVEPEEATPTALPEEVEEVVPPHREEAPAVFVEEEEEEERARRRRPRSPRRGRRRDEIINVDEEEYEV